MTERKPPGVDFETFIDRQVREAEARGEFSNLAGLGKPLPSADAPYDEMWWIKRKMHEEGVSYLPATLALRKEVEDTLEEAARAPSEARVRHLVAGVNERIEAAMRTAMDGPPHNLTPVEVERFVERWREERGISAPEVSDAPDASEAGPRRRAWWRGRR